MTIERVDPPMKNRRTVDWDWEKITAKAKAEPLVWFRIAKQGKVSTANAITEGKISSIHPSNGFEVTTADTRRDAQPRTADIFVRYNPDKDQGITAKERRSALSLARKKEKENKE